MPQDVALTAEMETGVKMKGTSRWLLLSVAFICLFSPTEGSTMKVLAAPNLLRVGAAENIFVECQDCPDENNFTVQVNVLNYPTKAKRLAATSVELTSANRFQAFGQIQIPARAFHQDPNIKQYVYLQAQFPDANLEKIVLLSFHSGYIFIQTDKTLYTPNSKVYFRIFALTPDMKPVERDNQTQMDTSVTIEFVTPDGIILPRDPVSLRSGIHSGDFQLGEVVSVGLWKITARFHSKPHVSFSAEFEVKDYVLPSFEVKLSYQDSFFYVDSEELSIEIKANYLFGEAVEGSAYGIFGVVHRDQKKSFPSSFQRVSIEDGEGVLTLKREHITQTYDNITDLVGSSLFVAVSVLTADGGEMVEAELRGMYIVTSAHTIHFTKTPKYFKPGMSFDVTLEVLNPDGTPSAGVPVVIDAGEVEGVTSDNGLAKLSINTVEDPKPMTLTAKTNIPRLSAEKQATASMTALPYRSDSNSYIHIGVTTANVRLGDNLKMNINFNKQENAQTDLTYLIQSRGQLVKYGRFRAKGQLLISMTFTVTKEMLPSFRIIAYYHPDDNEVVSDSVWVDVKDSCMGSLKLEPVGQHASYEPRKKFSLKITGDPQATVGLVAVDKGVFVLNNKYQLTQKTIWDTVEKYDTGCTSGGGRDSMSVFYDAGLLFETSTLSGTPYRQDLNCSAPGRRKRASVMMNITTSLLSLYEDELQRDCCLDGMRDTTVSYSCERRSKYITDGPACVEAFLQCCVEIKRLRAEIKEDGLKLARSESDDNSYMDSNDVVSRTNFPETWLWSDITLPSCPDRTPDCEATSYVKPVPLQDTITTWKLAGISLSKTHGLCVADPLDVIVRKDFFIDLRMPSSCVRGEQIEIKAVLHNHSPNPATIRLDLIEAAHVCSLASKRGKYRQEVNIAAKSTRSVPIVIIPTREGQFRIELKAAVKDSAVGDGIVKMLRVVPEGLLIKSPQTITLHPEGKSEDGKQVEIINSKIPLTNILPNSPTSTQISVKGKMPKDVLKNTIDGESMSSLIYQPSGCGEENMIHMTLPVIAATYLDKTNQWESAGLDKREEALLHISTGYQNQLAYCKKDESFDEYPGHQQSTWLTAYVVKVFVMANDLVRIQSKDVCDAVKFLIRHTQEPDGSFKEVGSIAHLEMTGDVYGTDSDASLTAFCLVAMQESRKICAADVKNLMSSINKGVVYLEKRLPSLVNPYAVAMTSYALANENKLNLEILYSFASQDLSHWQVPMGRVHTLEATAYALLALVKIKAFKEAKPVVRWFNKQIRENGGFGSTQATMTVYQAVAEYWTSDKDSDYDLNVDILLPGRSKPDKYNFNNENHFATRSSKVNNINQDVKVIATGPGEATVTVVSLYYALPIEKDSDCQKFNMSVQLIPEKMAEDEKIYKLKIEILYKNRYRDAPMTTLEVGLLTGFTVNTKDLNLLSKGHARTIARYQENYNASERSSLLIHLDKVSHTEPDEITFRVHQKMKVGVLQPASVFIYEFNNQQDNDQHRDQNENRCVKFYHPERRAGKLLRLCTNDTCTCAEENCSKQKKGQISNDDRTTKVCETQLNSRIEFVYKVRLDKFTEELSTDIYTVHVLYVLKEGSYDVGPQNKQRMFLSYPHCRDVLDLEIGKTYLIMGTSKDIYTDAQSQSYRYVFGEKAWLEYWPTETECETAKYKPTCEGMEEMVQQYTLHGCPH